VATTPSPGGGGTLSSESTTPAISSLLASTGSPGSALGGEALLSTGDGDFGAGCAAGGGGGTQSRRDDEGNLDKYAPGDGVDEDSMVLQSESALARLHTCYESYYATLPLDPGELDVGVLAADLFTSGEVVEKKGRPAVINPCSGYVNIVTGEDWSALFSTSLGPLLRHYALRHSPNVNALLREDLLYELECLVVPNPLPERPPAGERTCREMLDDEEFVPMARDAGAEGKWSTWSSYERSKIPESQGIYEWGIAIDGLPATTFPVYLGQTTGQTLSARLKQEHGNGHGRLGPCIKRLRKAGLIKLEVRWMTFPDSANPKTVESAILRDLDYLLNVQENVSAKHSVRVMTGHVLETTSYDVWIRPEASGREVVWTTEVDGTLAILVPGAEARVVLANEATAEEKQRGIPALLFPSAVPSGASGGGGGRATPGAGRSKRVLNMSATVPSKIGGTPAAHAKASLLRQSFFPRRALATPAPVPPHPTGLPPSITPPSLSSSSSSAHTTGSGRSPRTAGPQGSE
jgi:hypothetical protein